MTHIPPHKLLPQDMVDIYDHGPEDEPFAEPDVIRMHAVDAKHAMAVEPKRYALDPFKVESDDFQKGLD